MSLSNKSPTEVLYKPKPEKPTHEGDDEILRFVIFKVNRAGHKKNRVIALHTRSRTLVSCSTKGEKSKTLQLRDVTKIERCPDKKKCIVFFGHRAPCNFTFPDISHRERFLGRLTTLWELVLSEKAAGQTKLPPTATADPNNLRILTFTWNVAESTPPGSDMMAVCLGDVAAHDLYIIGLQECSKKKEAWISAIKYFLEFGGVTFQLIAKVVLWDMMLFVLAKDSVARLIHHVETDSVACGVGDVLGNKGGVGVCFNICDTSFCVVNCHLAARAERVPQRQANYIRIVQSLQLGFKSIDILNQFDHLIWMGDLNYRVDAEFHTTIIDLEKERWPAIAKNDQLRSEMAKQHVLTNFQEGPLNFVPTYRWDRNNNEISNKREQTPSWTDRILWQSLVSSELELKSYNSIPMAFGSDHRPVAATYLLHPHFPYTGVNLFSHTDWRQDRKHIEIHVETPVIHWLDSGLQDIKKLQFSVIITAAILSQSVSPPPMTHLAGKTWEGVTIELTPYIFDRRLVRRSYLIVAFSFVNSTPVAEDVSTKPLEDSKADPKKGVEGCTVIPLVNVFEENSTFDVPITNGGQRVGRYTGVLKVIQKGATGFLVEVPDFKPAKPPSRGGKLANLFAKTATIFQDTTDGVELNTDTDAAELTHVSFPFNTIKEKWLFYAEEYLTPQKDPGPVAALHGALCCLKDLYCLGGGNWAATLPLEIGLIKATSDCGNSSVSMGLSWVYFRDKGENQLLGVLNCGAGGIRLQLYLRSKGVVSCLLEYKPPGSGKGVLSNLRCGSYVPSKEQTPDQLKDEIKGLLHSAPWNNPKLRQKLEKQFKVKKGELQVPVVAFVSGAIRNHWESKTTDPKDSEVIEKAVNDVLDSVLPANGHFSWILGFEKHYLMRQKTEGRMELVGLRGLYNQYSEFTSRFEQLPLEPVISLGIGKSSSQWTSLYLGAPDDFNRYSLEPELKYGMDSDDLAERLASAIVAQYRPYQAGLVRLMLSVSERNCVPVIALKSGCLLHLDDGAKSLKGVTGKQRRKALVEFPRAVKINPTNVTLLRRSGESCEYTVQWNSVAIACADACTLLARADELPVPQFLKVNIEGQSTFLQDLDKIPAGTRLVFSTAAELSGRVAAPPAKSPREVKTGQPEATDKPKPSPKPEQKAPENPTEKVQTAPYSGGATTPVVISIRIPGKFFESGVGEGIELQSNNEASPGEVIRQAVRLLKTHPGILKDSLPSMFGLFKNGKEPLDDLDSVYEQGKLAELVLKEAT